MQGSLSGEILGLYMELTPLHHPSLTPCMDDKMNRIDPKSEAFLRVLAEKGGCATTRDIRRRTGMSQAKRNYRFEKLDDLGLIKVDRKDSNYSGSNPPKRAELTDEGRAVLSSGLSDEAKDWLVECEVTRRIDDLENRVDMLEHSTAQNDDRLSELENWTDKFRSLWESLGRTE